MGHSIAFIFFGLAAVGLALAAILHRNIFKSATFLAGMLFSTAALFITLEAEFVAVVQVLVYIGAITILIVFAIMLTMKISDEHREQFNAQRYLALVVGLGILGVLTAFLLKGPGSAEAVTGSLPADPLWEIGRVLISNFILPFDVVTVLLLIALVGATFLAKHDDDTLASQEVPSTAERSEHEEEKEKSEVLVH